MQRVRIGIMGLAGVFLLVVLATALYSLFGDRSQSPAGTRGQLQANSAEEAPREPLAELGVAPGNVAPETNSAAPTGRPQPAKGK
jgi:hypothetical protein